MGKKIKKRYLWSHFQKKEIEPTIEVSQLEEIFKDVLRRADILASHDIQSEPLSVRERMSNILDNLQNCLLYTSPSPRDRG